VSDRQLTLSKAIPANSLLKIYRETTTDTIVSWNDASVLRAKDMSLQEVQLLHLAEETADKVFDTGMSTSPTNTNVWDGQYKRITNLLDPQEDGDAVTLRYVNDKQHGLLNALKNEGANQNTSIVATGDAQNTRLTNTGDSYVATMTTLKEDATAKANEASNSATSASSSASTATTKATEASNSATSASSSASTATTKATEASNSAELAKKWAMSDSSPDGVSGNKSSKTWANEAKNSANSASSSASTATTKATEASNSASAAAKSAENAKTWDPTSYYTKTEVDNKVSKAHHYLSRNTAYKVGDIAYSPNLPSYLYLECTTAGTTGATEPDMSTLSGGAIVNDGTAQFSVKTVCAKEYVDLKFDHIECGTIEKFALPGYKGTYITVETKYPHDTSKPVIIGHGAGESGWANLTAIFHHWIDSTHFLVEAWNNFNIAGTASFVWICT
jgi:hypothetical protein